MLNYLSMPEKGNCVYVLCVCRASTLLGAQSYFGLEEKTKFCIISLYLSTSLFFFWKALLFIYLAVPGFSCSMRIFSCCLRDRIWVPWLEVWSLSHWTTRKVPLVFFFKSMRIIILWLYKGQATHPNTHTKDNTYSVLGQSINCRIQNHCLES